VIDSRTPFVKSRVARSAQRIQLDEPGRRLERGVGLSVEPPGNVVQVRTDFDSTFPGVKSWGHAKLSGNPKRLSVAPLRSIKS
jgi:hypothetical protein